MRYRYSLITYAWLTLLAGTSCTVYTPMQPHAPLIRAQGEAEVLVQVQPSLRPELAAAYSPLPHLLVLGGVTARPRLPVPTGGGGGEDESFHFRIDNFRTLQYEAGVGGYFPLSSAWTAQLTAGVGDAHVQRRVIEPAIIFGGFCGDFEARYHKRFGQFGLNYQAGNIALGFGYRLTNVVFRQLSLQKCCGDYAYHELPTPNQLRHEPYAFFRVLMGKSPATSRWQFQGATSVSVLNRQDAANTNIFLRYTEKNSILTSFGMTYFLRPR